MISGTHYTHSFITNKVNITDANTNYHINAEPVSCCCCDGAYTYCTSCSQCYCGTCCGGNTDICE